MSSKWIDLEYKANKFAIHKWITQDQGYTMEYISRRAQEEREYLHKVKFGWIAVRNGINQTYQKFLKRVKEEWEKQIAIEKAWGLITYYNRNVERYFDIISSPFNDFEYGGKMILNDNYEKAVRYISHIWNVGNGERGSYNFLYYRPISYLYEIIGDPEEIHCPLCFYEFIHSGHKVNQDPYNRCASLFKNKEELVNYKFVITRDTCLTHKDIPTGALVGYTNSDFPEQLYIEGNRAKNMYTEKIFRHRMAYEWTKGEYVKGRKYKFVRLVNKYTNATARRCCLKTNTKRCPKNLLSFESGDCDYIMLEHCKQWKYIGTKKCLIWMTDTVKRDKDIAMNIYINHCSDHLGTPLCDIFINIIREKSYLYKFGDIAIDNFCKKHPNDQRCWCSFTPLKIKEEIINQYGNKECFLSYCTSVDSYYFLKYYNFINKQNCLEINCSVTIDQLKLSNDAVVEIMNDCITSSKIINSNDSNEVEPQVILDYFSFSFPLFFLLVVFIFFYLCQKRYTNIVPSKRKVI